MKHSNSTCRARAHTLYHANCRSQDLHTRVEAQEERGAVRTAPQSLHSARYLAKLKVAMSDARLEVIEDLDGFQRDLAGDKHVGD